MRIITHSYMNGQGLGFWRETITSRAHMTKNKLVTTATFGSGFSRGHVMLAATAAIGLLNARPDAAHSDERNVSDEASMTSAASPRNPVMTRDQLVDRLKRA